MTASFIESVNNAVEREAKRYNCSKSFVIANCCGFALNVPIKDLYQNKKN